MEGGLTIWRELRSLAARDRVGRWALPLHLRKQIVAEAIDKLPERSRLLLALRYYEGLGVQELSCALGLSSQEVCREISKAVSQVYRTLIRAEEKVRKEARA